VNVPSPPSSSISSCSPFLDSEADGRCEGLKDELGVEMEEREEEGGKPVTPAEEVEEDEWEWRERGEGRMGVVID
jgi:hypothetical protein